MKKTTLAIMAAGIGSRFGKGIKQLEKVGPSGEIIMDYSIHDALEAGFNKIVFIIRKDIEKEFHEIIGKRIAKLAEVSYVFQDINDLPEGFSTDPARTKPWGTGQAILAAREVIHEPFAVINADDYYGKEAFRQLHTYLSQDHIRPEGVHDVCLVSFRLGNTLSENGGVTRGICKLNEGGSLVGIHETKNIVKTKDGAAIANGEELEAVDPDSRVSMNMWGLQPQFIEALQEGFVQFLSAQDLDPLKGEYLLPTYIDALLQSGKAQVSVLNSSDTWFGVTYQEDKAAVKEAFDRLISEGVYRTSLYSDLNA